MFRFANFLITASSVSTGSEASRVHQNENQI